MLYIVSKENISHPLFLVKTDNEKRVAEIVGFDVTSNNQILLADNDVWVLSSNMECMIKAT